MFNGFSPSIQILIISLFIDNVSDRYYPHICKKCGSFDVAQYETCRKRIKHNTKCSSCPRICNTEGLKLGWGWNKGINQVDVTCFTCGKMFTSYKGRKYCDMVCRNKGYIGVKRQPRSQETKDKISAAQIGKPKKYRGTRHHNWRGGITSKDKKERLRFRKIMQKRIFERDGYKCQHCGSNEYLQVDHIKRWSEYPELRFNEDNCRTLCSACHYRVTFNKEKPSGLAWGQNLCKSREALTS